MTDKLTTDERVALAEYCGHDAYIEHGGYVRTIKHDKWQPDVDANQRDRLVESLMTDGWESIQSASRHDDPPFECELNHTNSVTGDPDRQSQLGEANTPGLAVCWAALKVIADNS